MRGVGSKKQEYAAFTTCFILFVMPFFENWVAKWQKKRFLTTPNQIFDCVQHKKRVVKNGKTSLLLPSPSVLNEFQSKIVCKFFITHPKRAMCFA